VAAPVGGSAHAHSFVLITAVSARKRLDAAYRRFLGLMSDQFSAAVARAVRRHQESERAERLAELDRAKTAFLSTVSHELRTPLTLVLGPLQNLLEQPDTAGSPEVQSAYRNARRLLRLVNTLLDFSRIEAGRMAFRPRPTDVAALTRDCASLFTSLAAARGLELRVDCAEPVLAEIDRDMWEKIVLNVVSNAVKYTRHGHVGVRVEHRDGSAVLVVSDSGIGIPSDEVPLIFDRFHRTLSDLTPSVEGTGLGLALVRELATIHDGTAVVHSTPGVGSTFVVSVPALDPADDVMLPEPLDNGHAIDVDALFDDAAASNGNGAEAASGGAARVLVVDDNRDMREFLARALAPLAEVDLAEDGRDALIRARRQSPDLIVSDVMMPVIDGVGLLAALRAEPELAEVPVILLSARADHESLIAGLDAGAADFLAKPFSTGELRSRVRTNLAAVQLRKARAADAAEALRRREQQALELNDRIVQGMIVARMALDAGQLETVVSALDSSIKGASTIITELLGDPAGLLRSTPADLEMNP
jgi:signal transduction histidine kinase/FixJ family two-component response regulator